MHGASLPTPPRSSPSATSKGAASSPSRSPTSPAGTVRARALLLLADIAWIGGRPGAIEQLELALEAAQSDSALLAQIHAKLVNVSVALDPAGLLRRARAAAEAIDPERDPGPAASVYLDLVWAETLRGQRRAAGAARALARVRGAGRPRRAQDQVRAHLLLVRRRLRGRSCALRDRGALVSGARGGRVAGGASRPRLPSGAAAGNWDAAERGIEEACETIAQLETPGPWAALFRIRAHVDAHRGRLERALAAYRAEGAGNLWWEALRLSGLAIVEDAAGNHTEVDRALTRMHELTDSVGVRDFVPDRSEPIHVESLVALGELERAREELARLEERGKMFPRLWITVTLPRTRALVLAAEGDVTGALAALDELDVEAAAKLPFELGRALLVRGRLLRRAKQKRAAADTLREALDDLRATRSVRRGRRRRAASSIASVSGARKATSRPRSGEWRSSRRKGSRTARSRPKRS